MDFERIDSREIWQGRVGGVRLDTFRYADGGEADREQADREAEEALAQTEVAAVAGQHHDEVRSRLTGSRHPGADGRAQPR